MQPRVRPLLALVLSCILLLGILPPGSLALARPIRQNYPPFSLPFASPPGPATWLIGQQYGNTATAFNLGKYWYRAGQGLHFGLDFAAPCGTPVTAIGDGVVAYVDNFNIGLLPHNVVIYHAITGNDSIYGHLLARSHLVKGQIVKRGQVIGFTGDPDLTCSSRPHLHLEIRSRNLLTAYDPAAFINADWPMLSSIGYYTFGGFVKDLYHADRWQTIADQPSIRFKAKVVNNFDQSWPPDARLKPAPRTLPAFTAPPIAEGIAPQFPELSEPGCCSLAWWSADSKQVLFFEGPSGKLASVMAVGVDGSGPQLSETAPPTLWSANSLYRLKWANGKTQVERLKDSFTWTLSTGAWPEFSPNNTWLMWQYLPREDVPGSLSPMSEIWIAKLDDSAPTLILRQEGGAALWLDDDRLLLLTQVPETDIIDLKIYTISTRIMYTLTAVINLRGLSVAPGGRDVMYYAPFQPERSESGIYLLDRNQGSKPVLMPFFGSWRWRDGNSVVYIPYEPGSPMSFDLYNIWTRQSRRLTDPITQAFRIANDDWSISPDGRYIAMWQSRSQLNTPYLTLVTLPPAR